jgi:hypothetical protein
MSGRTRSVLLLTSGVLLFLIALAADSLGLGSTPGIGYKQLVAALIGIILAAVGMAGLRGRGST